MKKTVSRILLTFLLVSVFALAFNIQPVKASGTIYIRADGSIDPPTAPIFTTDNLTYTLTGNITSDGDGIIVLRSDMTFNGAGYTLQGTTTSSTGIYVESGSNVTIKNAKINGFGSGISFFGYTPALKFNKVVGNDIVNNTRGIMGGGFSYSIARNNIIANTWGIELFASSNNSIIGNNITANEEGIALWDESSNNSIFGNNIESNIYGISLIYGSSNNRIFHNNFINNTTQADSVGYNNTWDNGYPSGGNYWSDYAGVDLNSDGIGDTQYVIDSNNIDNYPLMGMFSDFKATLENHVQAICNSTISDFQFNGTAMSFNVSGEVGTTGFCRICIPTALLSSPLKVLVDGIEIPYSLLPCSNSTHNYLYLTYVHSTHEIVITKISPLTYALTITTSAGGTTDPAPGAYSYTASSQAQVTAFPNTGYLFDHWELDNANMGSANRYTVLMNKNHTLKAIFSHVKPAVPVGGYSFSIEVQTTTNPSNIYVATIAVLAAVFTIFKRKTRKTK